MNSCEGGWRSRIQPTFGEAPQPPAANYRTPRSVQHDPHPRRSGFYIYSPAADSAALATVAAAEPLLGSGAAAPGGTARTGHGAT